MKRHPFRWESLAFGAFYLAIVGNWAVWEKDLLTPKELSVTASIILIAFGLVGIAATLRPTRTPDNPPTSRTSEGTENEEADPQP